MEESSIGTSATTPALLTSITPAMPKTTHYYTHHATKFFTSTVHVDMTPLHQRLLERLPAGAAILDAGCGSGRDARGFAERGYRVSAFDASPALAALPDALAPEIWLTDDRRPDRTERWTHALLDRH